MEFQSLEIDKYIDWYFKLSLEIELLPMNQERADRYAVASFYLFQRHFKNSNNVKSQTLSDEFSQKAKEIQQQVEDVKIYRMPELEKVFYIPTLQDWNTIKFLRKEFIDSDINELNKKLSNTPLPELDFLRLTLSELKADRPVQLLNQFIKVQPLPSGCSITDFVHNINTIDFAQYLHNEISQLELGEQGNGSTKKPLSWKANKNELSELIKALSLTAFVGIPEIKIIRAFESIIGDENGDPLDMKDRHYQNLKAYEQAKNRMPFTNKLDKVFRDFLNKKLDEEKHNKK